MTLDIALTLAILALAVILFMTERLRVDAVALLVLVSLVLTGLVTPAEALSGFSNLAVITVWAMFILSAGLSRTGVASAVGRQVLRLAGEGEVRLIIIIMVTVGVLSAFMNDIGVATLMLPVVMDIARRTKMPPSKLLMPLAFAALLGGLNTLIGTPPNILISEALREAGLRPFRMFDYTPVGAVVMVVGIAFVALVGRRLLPTRDIEKESLGRSRRDTREKYELGERLFVVGLPADSPLAGKTMAESRLGSILGLNVIAIIKNGRAQLAPGPNALLHAGARLVVEGRTDALFEMRGRRQLMIEESGLAIEALVSSDVDILEVVLSPRSSLQGQTLAQVDFRQQFGVNVLAIRRGGSPQLSNLRSIPLEAGDQMLVQGPREQLDRLRRDANFRVLDEERAEVYRLHEQLMLIRVPAESALVGKTLTESRLGDAFGLTVLGIVRQGITRMVPGPEEQLMAGDTLLVEGTPESLETLEGLQRLIVDRTEDMGLDELETERIGLVEAVLSPETTLAGKSLRELHFREKYGLNVLAIWREGRAFRSNLRDITLRYGDALLLFGPRERLKMLAGERDFLILTEEAQEVPRWQKAPLALLVMVLVLTTAILGWLPIAIAAVAGVVLMVILGCLTMEEAQRSIEWKAVFLIAGMLPLGIAMANSGAAQFLAEGMVSIVGGLGPLAVMAGLFVLAALGSQVMPNPAVAVLLAPIALSTARDLQISPYPLMMVTAVAASAAFLSPVGHSANVLIMGPGGYRFADYIKVGVPLTLVVLLVTLLVLPIFWPL